MADITFHNIHKTAVIDPNVKMGDNVTVGPYSIIEGEVTIGDNVTIGSHCVLSGKTTIGRGCQFFSGAVIGGPAQDKKDSPNNEVSLTIGENNVFREYVTVNLGTLDGGGRTTIGNGNLLMAYSHVAHDCKVGNDCVIANLGTLAGHVILEDRVIIGGLTGVHQFVRIGRQSIIGGCSKVVQDIAPYAMCDGNPLRVISINSVGLRRAKYPVKTMQALKKAFKILFHSGLSRSHAFEQVEAEMAHIPEVQHLLSFIRESKRGVGN